MINKMPRGPHLKDSTIDRFLKEVEQSTFLYDPNTRGYLDAEKKNNFWDNLALSLKVKEMDGNSWRARWRNMRDSYVKKRKILKKKKIGINDKRPAKWKFYDQMHFLEPFLTEASPPLNVAVKEEPVYESHAENDMLEEVSSNRSSMSEYLETDSTETFQDIKLNPTNQHKWRTRKFSAEGEGFLEGEPVTDFMKQSNRGQKFQTRDADMLLFQSYALRMKQLPKDVQAVVKMQMSQIFFNAENANGPQVEILSTVRYNPQILIHSQPYENGQT